MTIRSERSANESLVRPPADVRWLRPPPIRLSKPRMRDSLGPVLFAVLLGLCGAMWLAGALGVLR